MVHKTFTQYYKLMYTIKHIMNLIFAPFRVQIYMHTLQLSQLVYKKSV